MTWVITVAPQLTFTLLFRRKSGRSIASRNNEVRL
jgi:hypothetical protein